MIDLFFDETKSSGYKSNSQKIRVMSESWFGENLFCPVCGNFRLTKLPNNQPVADFQCGCCGEIFELKSECGNISRKISDGSYFSAIERITSFSNPHLFVLGYDERFCVSNLVVIPKHLFTPRVIEKRKPLSDTAMRAGWVGCNILLEDIPEQGKIPIIRNQVVREKEQVIKDFSKVNDLKIDNIQTREWLFDVLFCIEQIHSDFFTLSDVYRYVDILKAQHPLNNNIEAKIRQQLQLLRDKGYIDFLGNGHYHKKHF